MHSLNRKQVGRAMDGLEVTNKGNGALLTVSVEGKTLATEILHCVSPSARKRGLLGRAGISPEEGALLVMPSARRNKRGVRTSIHMIGIRFPVGVAWLDGRRRVVYATTAKPWRPYYASPEPASFVLEVHPVHRWALQKGVLVSWRETEKS